MNDRRKTPGPVLEEAGPIGAGTGQPRESNRFHEARSHGDPQGERADGIANGAEPSRRPGPVSAPSQPIERLPDLSAGNALYSQRSTHNGWATAFWLFSAFVGAWLLYGTVTALMAVWQQNLWVAAPLTALGVATLGVLVWTGHREYKAWKRIDRLSERSSLIESAKRSNDIAVVRKALSGTLAALRKRHPGLIDEFNAAAEARTAVDDYLELLDNLVLTELDDEVKTVMNRSALMTGAAVAVVPHPALDAAIVVWRATSLTRKIGEIYGLEPTGLSSLRLFKHTIVSAIIAAGMEAGGDLLVEEAGRGVLESAGKRVAEAAVLAARLRRLGLAAKRLCRPIPPARG